MTDADELNCLGSIVESGVAGLRGCIFLAGIDLTNFNYDCETSNDCDTSTYEDYDGYSVILKFLDDGSSFLTNYGFCFDSKHCVVMRPNDLVYDFN